MIRGALDSDLGEGGGGPRAGCRIYGLEIDSGLDLYTRRRRGPAEADVRVLLGSNVPHTREVPEGDLMAQWSIESGLRASFVRCGDGTHLLRFEQTCDVIVDPIEGLVRVHMVEGVSPAMGGVLVSGTVLSYLLMLRGERVLHASAVDMGSHAVGIVGSSGMGKTTLATLLCRDGGLLITDDVLRLDPGSAGGFGCALGATEVRLRQAAVGLSEDFDQRATHRDTADDRRALSVPTSTTEHVPLCALLIPRPRRDGAPLALTRIPAAQATMALLSFPRILGVRDSDLLAMQLRQMADVAASVPLFVADVPWGPPFAAGLAGDLMAMLGDLVGGETDRGELADADPVSALVAECGQIPPAADDELAALQVAIHLEEATGRRVPAELLAPAHLVGQSALSSTVRRLLGDA